ncbi:NADPH-dependent FMN reductase [Rhizobium leguminosarum]
MYEQQLNRPRSSDMAKPTVAVIVGSTRKESINLRLAEAIMRLGADALQFKLISIADLPLYNLDLESDWPESAKRFSGEVRAANAVLIVSPEHNRSLPAVLKNCIDWGSRPGAESVWRDRPVAIIGAARGAIGTALVQQHLRVILGTLGAHLLGGEAYIGGFAPELIDEERGVTVETTKAFLQAFVDRFASFTKRFAA